MSELSVEAWDRVLTVNLRAVFLLCRLVVPDMIDADRGTIVNVSSVAGRRGWANASAYCASKFALTGFTQALGAEIRPHGVRACVVYPGAMATQWGPWTPEERSDDRESARPREALPPEQSRSSSPGSPPLRRTRCSTRRVVTPLGEHGYP